MGFLKLKSVDEILEASSDDLSKRARQARYARKVTSHSESRTSSEKRLKWRRTYRVVQSENTASKRIYDIGRLDGVVRKDAASNTLAHTLYRRKQAMNGNLSKYARAATIADI
eukprot:647999-Pleurochrysis_carterae.AAC.4